MSSKYQGPGTRYTFSLIQSSQPEVIIRKEQDEVHHFCPKKRIRKEDLRQRLAFLFDKKQKHTHTHTHTKGLKFTTRKG